LAADIVVAVKAKPAMRIERVLNVVHSAALE
jgi:hypothetical protein